MHRINPLYILVLFFTVTLILLFNANIKKEQLDQSNLELSTFHKQLNQYTILSKSDLSQNMIIEEVKKVIDSELPGDINIGVKTLSKHIEINIKEEKYPIKLMVLDAFNKSSLEIEQLSMDNDQIVLKVKL